jgi:hypothetical protein
MPHRFVIKDRGQLQVYHRYEDIPMVFDLVIEFSPEVPPGPHTREQHEEIESWVWKFDRLMERERASSSKTR